MSKRSVSKLDKRFRDWTPLDPDIKGFAQDLALRRGRRDRTVREYARDLEIVSAFVKGVAASKKQRGLDGRWYEVPNRGPFSGALVRAKDNDLEAFLLSLGARNLSIAARRRKIAAIRTFFSYLVDRKLRKDNPSVALSNLKPPDRLPKALDLEHIMKLLRTQAAAGTSEFRRRRGAAILEFLYASGVRRAELAGLSLGDVNLKERIARVTGKGGNQRAVPFNNAARDALVRYLEVRPPTRDEALFVSEHGGRLSYPQIANIFRSYVRLSGLKGKITPHTFRHTLATHLLERGVDIMTVKDILGHKNVSTTQVYTKMTLPHIRQVYDEAHPRDSQKD